MKQFVRTDVQSVSYNPFFSQQARSYASGERTVQNVKPSAFLDCIANASPYSRVTTLLGLGRRRLRWLGAEKEARADVARALDPATEQHDPMGSLYDPVRPFSLYLA
jgi:hypothetical protein